MEEVYQSINQNFKNFLLEEKYSIRGGEDVLKVPLQKLLGKLIIMTSGPIGDTSLDQVVHLRLGDRVKKMSFSELRNQDRNEMVQFN